jgi:hypothetical protein
LRVIYPKEDGDAIALQFGDGTNWRTVQTGRIYDVGSGRSGYGFVRAAALRSAWSCRPTARTPTARAARVRSARDEG